MDKEYSEYSFYVKGPECGVDDTIHLSVLLADIQEAAEVGASECGFDTAEINSKNACWIVLRNKLHLERKPRWRETIKVKTWHTGVDKLYYGREYELYDADNIRIGYASSAWIIADMDTHRPVIPGRTPGFVAAPPQNEYMVFGETCPRLKAPQYPDTEPNIVKYGDYSELDHNHHVNNSRYMAWIFDALHKLNLDVNKFNEVNINYLSEVKDSEKVEIFVDEISDDKYIVTGYKSNKEPVFVSEITICVW